MRTYRNLKELNTLFSRGEKLSLSDIMRKFKCSERNAYRYLSLLKKSFKKPIFYYPLTKKYYYKDTKSFVPFIPFTEEEIELIDKLYYTVKGTKNILKTENWSNIHHKFKKYLPDRELLPLPSDMEKTKRKIFILYNSIIESRTLKIYFEDKDFLFDPYFLFPYLGKWFATGRVHEESLFRTINIDNIKKVEQTSDFFLPDFLFIHSPLFKMPYKEKTICIRIKKQAREFFLQSGIIREENKVFFYKNGDIKFCIKVFHPETIFIWIFTFLPFIEILKPYSLRKKISRILEKSLKKYKK